MSSSLSSDACLFSLFTCVSLANLFLYAYVALCQMNPDVRVAVRSFLVILLHMAYL